jgi:hypothetical protein
MKAAQTVVAAYPYCDESGLEIFQNVRYEPKDFKARRSAENGKWVYNLDGTRRILFNLQGVLRGIKDGRTIFIVEGEKDVINLVRIGFVATCNYGGAGKWLPEYTETLKGANVVMLPDNDESGQKHIDVVAPQLTAAGIKVHVLNLPGLLEKQDVSDWIEAGGTAEQLKALVETDAYLWTAISSRNQEEDEEPMPLCRELPPAPPAPLDLLPPILKGLIDAVSDVVQCSPGLVLNCGLAAASLAVAGHADVVMDGRRFPINLFLATIGDSGERKTAVDNIVLAAHDEHEKLKYQQHAEAMKDYARDKAAYDKVYNNYLRKQKGQNKEAVKDVSKGLFDLGEPPAMPFGPPSRTEEPTFEGICRWYLTNIRLLGLFSNEGGRFLGGYGMQEETKLKTITGLSKLFDGSPLDRVRAGEAPTKIYGARLVFHLLIQSMVADIWFSDRISAAQGFLSRILVSRPPSTIGKRPYRAVDIQKHPAVVAYRRHMLGLLAVDLPLADDGTPALNPRVITLDDDAKGVFIACHDSIEKELPYKYSEIKGFAAKAAEHAVRIAATLQLFDDIRATQIGAEYMAAGVELANYYLEEALRLFGTASVSNDLREAGELLDWLVHKHKKPLVWIGDVYQRGPQCVREAKRARALMRELMDHNHVRRAAEQKEIDGKLRTEVYEVVALKDSSPQ